MVALSQEVILLDIGQVQTISHYYYLSKLGPYPTVFDGNPRFGRFLKNFIGFSYTCHRYKTVKS